MSKAVLQRYKNITSGDMSQATVTSLVSNIQFLDNVGIQLNFTGTPTGTFEVQVSADYDRDAQGNVLNSGNWTPLTFVSTPSAAGAAGSIFLDINQLSAPWIRVVYTKGSGTGTLTGYITAKAIGA